MRDNLCFAGLMLYCAVASCVGVLYFNIDPNTLVGAIYSFTIGITGTIGFLWAIDVPFFQDEIKRIFKKKRP